MTSGHGAPKGRVWLEKEAVMLEGAPPPARVLPSSRQVLGVQAVSKAFRRGPPWHRRTIPVLDGATLHVDAGELVGLVGENGSGKSTLMQIIVGL
ncbi:MAG: ATP-binding cassette domain-containing protein, partial [Actinomycetota bacterium]